MASKPDRNDPCRCGSGKKYKNCCQEKDSRGGLSGVMIVLIVIAVLFGAFITGQVLFGSGGSDRPDCPPGTVWSEAHQHCH